MTLTDSEFHDLSVLLPFYVNGSATQAERAKVEDAMNRDPRVGQEIGLLTGLRQAYLDTPDAHAEGSPGEAGLKRLLAEIGATTGSSAPVGDIPTPANLNAPVWKRFAQLAAAAVFGALLSAAVLQQTSDEPGAEMVSGDAGIFLDAPTLTVQFSQVATVDQISAALREKRLIIVDGPSAIGLYRLAHLDGDEIGSGLAELLRRQDDIFETVDDPS